MTETVTGVPDVRKIDSARNPIGARGGDIPPLRYPLGPPGADLVQTLRKGIDMKKFLVLYKAPTSSFDQMMKASPEEQKAGMDAWMAWGGKAAASIVDMGAPLGRALRVTAAEASPIRNDLGGYSIMQAESKEALAKVMAGHPHFMTPEGFIEIVEIIPVPGM